MSDSQLSEHINIVLEEKVITEENIIHRLKLTKDERNKLEESTREQSAHPEGKDTSTTPIIPIQ